MRRRWWAPFGLGVLACTSLVAVAVAQPRGRGAPKKPPVASPSEASDAAVANDERGGGDAGVSGDAAAALANGNAGATANGNDGKTTGLTPPGEEWSDGGTPPQSIDYDRLLSEIAALRARIAAVQDTVFLSKVAVVVEPQSDRGRIAELSILVDEGVVYTKPATFVPSGRTLLYEHAISPGRHSIGIEIGFQDSRDPSFRTNQKSRFAVDVPRDNRLQVVFRVSDDSQIADDFPKNKSGLYDLRVRAEVSAAPVKR